MSSPKQFNVALRQWADVFMAHSMKAWMKFIRGSGLSMPQFNTMMKLYYRGSCAVSDVSDDLAVTPAAASQLVDKLVQFGYLERAEDPADRRAKLITLSAKGRELIQTGIEARNQWVEELGTHFDADQRLILITALAQLTEAARQIEPVSGAEAPKR